MLVCLGRWEERALCRGLPVETALAVFFPPANSHGHCCNYDAARSLCAGCPVQYDCAEAHLCDAFGFVGAMTPDERTAERARRRRLGLSWQQAPSLRFDAQLGWHWRGLPP